MLEIKNLSKKFGKKTVLNNIDYTFENGIYGLLGPNVPRYEQKTLSIT